LQGRVQATGAGRFARRLRFDCRRCCRRHFAVCSVYRFCFGSVPAEGRPLRCRYPQTHGRTLPFLVLVAAFALTPRCGALTCLPPIACTVCVHC
jgi:hypothetical protein